MFDGIDLKPSLVHGDFCSINVGQLNNDAGTVTELHIYFLVKPLGIFTLQCQLKKLSHISLGIIIMHLLH